MKVNISNLVNVWAAATHQAGDGKTGYYVDTSLSERRLDTHIPIRAAERAPSCETHVAMCFTNIGGGTYETEPMLVLAEFWRGDVQCTGFPEDASKPLVQITCDIVRYKRYGLYGFTLHEGPLIASALKPLILKTPTAVFVDPTIHELLSATDDRLMRPLVADSFFSEKRTENGQTYWRPNYAKWIV